MNSPQSNLHRRQRKTRLTETDRRRSFFGTSLLIIFVLTAWPIQPALAADSAASDPLLFKVMFSLWRSPARGLEKAQTGRLDVYVGDQLWNSYHVGPGGLMDFLIPRWETARLTLVVEDREHRHFRARFENGYLVMDNLDRNDRPVNYYQLADGAYAIEYFQDGLYITNQGATEAPILGALLTGKRVNPVTEDRFHAQACTIDPVPTQFWYAEGGTGSFYVTASACGGGGWDQSNPGFNWLELAGGGVTLGSGPFNYKVASYGSVFASGTGSKATTRSGTLNITASPGGGTLQQVNIIQSSEATPTGWPPPPEDGFGQPTSPDQILAGVLTGLGPLLAGQTSLCINTGRANETYCYHNLAAGFGFGSETTTTGWAVGGSIRPMAGGMPGVVFQWVYAGDRVPDEFFMPIGADGRLDNGADWQTFFDYNSTGVPMVVLLTSFPPEFLISLAPGEHTLNYWLVDSDGNKSNERTDTVTIE